jgi:peptidoglycan/xylan/chitin deacetylase (PgdA/CDA1 family)
VAAPLTRTRWLGTLTGVATDRPAVALTFDDGPHPGWTPRFLELLARHQARATFFVVGEAASQHPDILQRIRDAGHALGNHGWSHRSLPTLGPREQRAEIERGAALLGRERPRFFRPPYGHQSVRSRWSTGRAGARSVGWTTHIADWRQTGTAVLCARLEAALAPGSIVLLHDAIVVSEGVEPGPDLEPDRSALLGALDKALAAAAGRWRFVTLPELLEMGRPRWRGWFRYSREVG